MLRRVRRSSVNCKIAENSSLVAKFSHLDNSGTVYLLHDIFCCSNLAHAIYRFAPPDCSFKGSSIVPEFLNEHEVRNFLCSWSLHSTTMK